jgi:hypothetical protein
VTGSSFPSSSRIGTFGAGGLSPAPLSFRRIGA